MRLENRLQRLESQVQPPQNGNCYPGSNILILTGNFAFDKQQNAINHTRLYLNEAWREQATTRILNALADEEWHQSHHTDSWQGTQGERELWPVLRDAMTWLEKCELLTALEKMEVVEKRYPFWGNNYYDLFPEYRLNKEALCNYNHA